MSTIVNNLANMFGKKFSMGESPGTFSPGNRSYARKLVAPRSKSKSKSKSRSKNNTKKGTKAKRGRGVTSKKRTVKGQKLENMGMNVEKKTKAKVIKPEADILTLITGEDPSSYLAKGYEEKRATRTSIVLERKDVVKVKKVAAGEPTFHKLISDGYKPFEENETHVFLQNPKVSKSRATVANRTYTRKSRKSRYGMSLLEKAKQRHRNTRNALIKSRRI